jgi:predicted unusual protein kinase regulating ubiquinone biosynthesis (AarF/ABC1/UbiB family)
MSERSRQRAGAELKVGLARMFARAKQVLTTDPTGSDEDDRVVEEAAADALAKQAGQLKGGMAKVAQLIAYTAGGEAGGDARAALARLWDRAPAMSSADIARVVEADLGRPPQQLFAHWETAPLAAASLGQVHAAVTQDGVEVAVKVQYPGIAEALRADLASEGFARKLAGTELGRTLDDDAVAALREAVLGEIDYRREADATRRMAAAWAGDPAIRVPEVLDSLSSTRVLTMTRARGMTIVEAASADEDTRRQAAAAIFRFGWGSPLVHGLLNADPNPGNYLVARDSDGHVAVTFLDHGCLVELDAATIAGDKELWYGILHDDALAGAERFRVGLARVGLLRRADSLATSAHRDWERVLAAPLTGHGTYRWGRRHAAELADATQRVLAAGGVHLPAPVILLWRQRLGLAAVLGMLEAELPWRRLLVDLVGTGRKALW